MKTTVIIKREALTDGDVVRVVYPLHSDGPFTDPDLEHTDWIAMDFVAAVQGEVSRLTKVSIEDWGIGEQDGQVLHIDKIVKARVGK